MSHDKTPGMDSSVLAFPDTAGTEATIEQQASEWMAKLDGEHPSRQTRQAFKVWVNANPAHRHAFEDMIAFWDDMNVLTQAQLPREQAAHDGEEAGRFAPFGRGRKRFAPWAGALSAALVLAVLFLPFERGPRPDVYTTGVGEQMTIELADQSRVLLNTNSRLEVNYTEHKRQLKLLRGEAYFDVAHKPERPFEVFAGQGLVRAVGTAFTVHVRKIDVEVIVTEGSVELDHREPVLAPAVVQNTPAPEPIVVRVQAGDTLVYDRALIAQIETVLAGQLEAKLAWQKGLLVFDGEPLSTLVEEVGRYTDLKIIIPERKVRELKVGGLFKVGDTEALFEALRDSFDVHVQEVSEGVVYLVSSENRL